MQEVFKFGKKIIEKASIHVAKNYNKIKKVDNKKGHANLVTNVDKETEGIIVKAIKKSYPDHTIIAEESGLHSKDSKYEWIIDPIDGTTNFAHSYPFFCISIAFVVNGITKFGLVKNPFTNELFSAYKGKGAKLNEKKFTVSNRKKLSDSLLATGFPHEDKKSKLINFNRFKNLTLNSHGVRRDGAAALDLCYVACGRLDGFWEQKLNAWDVAAGVLIIEEAGGKITRYDGSKYSIYDKEILATNKHIHREIMKYLT